MVSGDVPVGSHRWLPVWLPSAGCDRSAADECRVSDIRRSRSSAGTALR